MVPPFGDESCRWSRADGHWVTLTIGRGADVGFVIVADSRGRREITDSYEHALKMARALRD